MDLGKAPEPGTIALIIVTALIVSLMTPFGRAAGEWALNLILTPFRLAKESVYRWIAPRNPLSIALRSYRKHVARSKLTRIENPVGPNLEVPLEHAFAPLKLISSATQESVDLFAHVAATHRSIVLGGPGTGKTTLMKSLVTAVVKGRARADALRDLIPVFVVLRNLARKGHTVEQAVVASFADYHFPGAEKFVESALSQGKFLVILDGLDEVGASREFAAEQILNFCEHDDQREHRNRLVVTCRENSYRTRDLHAAVPDVVRVEPFANHHMRVFLQGWPEHKGRLAVKLYGLIQSDPQLRDICRNPLLLTILTGLYLDTDNFELPTSRDRFYTEAVDELLIRRPARRQIKQSFDADEKRQVLERVALERLETVTPHEDPEEFTREAIARKASEVMRRADVDERELIKELVEVNGIIKPGSEGSYTCAHRTIQEYLAAREARRTRETQEVVRHFGGRADLVEVLYFYCGLLGNIPALESILRALAAEERWLMAGRCLTHMKEVPGESLIETVAAELHRRVTPEGYEAHLEVLSSLAQRREPDFELARRFFAVAVDSLAAGYGGRGASALESALATSPEVAMRVIPGLLRHQSERWLRAAVRLLRDIGTDEALDQLVLLLKDPTPLVRREAANTLTGMLRTRNRALRARAGLLPPRTDLNVWPLEAYFPGRLAIPIAEAVSADPGWGYEPNRSRAISSAARALRAASGEEDPETARDFLARWRRVPRDLKLQRYRRRAGTLIILAGLALPLAAVLALVALNFRGHFADRVVAVTLAPPRVRSMEGRWLSDFQRQAQMVVEDIEQRHPPNASGFSRVLPWNWWVEPALTEPQQETFEAVRGWAEESFDPYDLSDGALRLFFLKGLASDDKVNDLEARLDALEQHLPALPGGRHIIAKPAWYASVSLLIFAGALGITLRPFRRRVTGLMRGETFFVPLDNLSALTGSIVLATFPVLFWQGSLGLRWLPLAVLIIVGGAGVLLQEIDWPANEFLGAVDEVTPTAEADVVPEKRAPDWGDDDYDGSDFF